jgi:hypothetical protein
VKKQQSTIKVIYHDSLMELDRVLKKLKETSEEKDSFSIGVSLSR